MTHNIIARFYCDRCGGLAEREHGGAQPNGWSRLMLTTPVLANPLEVDSWRRKDHQICKDCTGELTDWLLGEPS